MMERNESSTRRMTLVSEKHSSSTGPVNGPAGSQGRPNLASVIEHLGSGRKSLSESLPVDSNHGNVSLQKEHLDDDMTLKLVRSLEDERSSLPMEQTRKQSADKTSSISDPENTDIIAFQESGVKSGFFQANSSIYQLYEIKMSALMRKNGLLEGQLAIALASRESAETNLSSVLKSRQEVEKRLNDTLKDMELMKEKLVLVEMAQEEANSLSDIVHSDDVRLEHDVAFLKAVLDDTQKELHSTRGVLSTERARAFQLQVEVFHLKQRLQSMENRTPTPKKPFHG